METVVVDLNFSTENQDNIVDPGARRAAPAGNGKLTPELFENAGVAVAPAESPKDELVPHQLMLSKAEILRQGREGMVQLSRGNDWASWKKVLPVLSIARSAAMLEANTNQPKGRRYCDAIGKWFRCHPEFEVLGKLDKGTRAHFFECLAKLEAIDEWRAKLPLEQQLRLNYPSTVLTHWKKPPAKAKPTGASKSKGDGQAKVPVDPVAVWKSFSEADKKAILNSEGRSGLAKLLSRELTVNLVDHLIRQEMVGASTKLKPAVSLTSILRATLDPTIDDSVVFERFKAKLKSLGLDLHDISIALKGRGKGKR